MPRWASRVLMHCVREQRSRPLLVFVEPAAEFGAGAMRTRRFFHYKKTAGFFFIETKPTAPGIPRRSPIQVLTGLNVA